MVWRAWVIFQEQIWFMVLPTLLLLAAAGKFRPSNLFKTSLNVVFPVTMLISGIMEFSPRLVNTGYIVYTAGYGLSLLTNATTTSLIMYKLWWVGIINLVAGTVCWVDVYFNHRSYRKYVADKIDPTRLRLSPVERALVIPIETGVIYCVFQVIHAISLAF